MTRIGRIYADNSLLILKNLRYLRTILIKPASAVVAAVVAVVAAVEVELRQTNVAIRDKPLPASIAPYPLSKP